jgi:hypothetical protein
MRKSVVTLFLIALALSVWGVQAREAQAAAKPLAVVSFSGYDEWKGDINYVGALADNPGLGTNMEGLLKLFTKGRGLEGLDKTRPWGALVQTDDGKFPGCAFLPVTDLDALMAVLEPFTGGVEQDGGLWKIKTGNATLFVKKKGDWAFVANKKQMLDQVPADPMKVIGDLNQQYDVAVRLFVANVPQKFRQKLVDKMHADAAGELQKKPHEDEEEYLVRKIFIEAVLENVTQVVEETEQVTLGWALDHEGEKTYIDVTASARPGTDLAKKFSRLGAAKTNFSGFSMPGAVFAASWAGTSMVDQDKVATVMDVVRKKAFEEIESEGKPEAETKLAKQLLGDVLDVVKETVAAGKADGGISVMAAPDAVTVVAGGFIADGLKLESVVKKVVQIVKGEHPQIASLVELDADSFQGVNLHRVSFPIPPQADDREKIVRMVGQTLEVVVGMGKEGMYMAAGRDAMKTLKKAIATSAQESQTAAPVEIALALRPIAKLVAEMGDDDEREDAAKVAAILEKTADLDHVKLTVTPIDHGARLRFEMERGILRLIGKMSTLRNQ